MPAPGSIVTTTSIDNQQIVLRYPRSDDAQALLDYINPISREQSFILMQGEQLTLAQEEAWLSGRLQSIVEGRGVFLAAEAGGMIVGTTHIDRKPFCESHIGVFGITVAKAFRGKGLGSFMMRTVIAEAVRQFPDLRIIELGVFANNERAISLYLREGFVEHGRLPNGIQHRGRYVDHIFMHWVVIR